MRKLSTLLAVSVLASAALGAGLAQAQVYAPPPPPGYYHHWHHGDRFYGHRHVEYHWDRYHLPPPPPGTFWVHDGPQFLLLDGHGVILRVWGG
jgi:hypothetical protein